MSPSPSAGAAAGPPRFEPAGTPRAPALAVVLAALVVPTGAVAAYRTGPPPAHTGAFGEPDCAECHFDAIREDPAGGADIAAPDGFRPGERFEVRVTVRHPALAAAGFQLSVRFAGGDAAGTQAGTLEAVRDGVQLASAAGVDYASHAEGGTAPDSSGARSWTVRWTAPDERDPVAFDVAANAANDDDSEFGDRLYLTRRIVEPR